MPQDFIGQGRGSCSGYTDSKRENFRLLSTPTRGMSSGAGIDPWPRRPSEWQRVCPSPRSEFDRQLARQRDHLLRERRLDRLAEVALGIVLGTALFGVAGERQLRPLDATITGRGDEQERQSVIVKIKLRAVPTSTL